jgi:hypothetical protein
MKSKLKELSQKIEFGILFLHNVTSGTKPLKEIPKSKISADLIGECFCNHRKIPFLIKNPFLEIIKWEIIDGKKSKDTSNKNNNTM